MASEGEAIFSQVSEKAVTRALVREFSAQLDEYAESDVLIAGGGPSGLMCGKALAERDVKVLIIESNNYLGGGFWLGGYLMNKVIVRQPADQTLREMGVPCRAVSEGMYVADGPHACSKLIAAACDAGVKFLNMTSVEDVVVRDGHRVAGLVVNWTPVRHLPREVSCVDPIALEAKVVVDATGHDAAVVRLLADRGVTRVPGCSPMWVERSENQVVEYTGQVHPGLVAVGMAVSAVHALPRMGPSFGAMLLSGARGAETVLEVLGSDVGASAAGMPSHASRR